MVLTCLAFQPLPASAQKAPGKTDIVVQGENPDVKRICTTQVETGSIMPRRVCRTKAQIDEQRDESLIASEQLRQERETAREIREICGTPKGCTPAL